MDVWASARNPAGLSELETAGCRSVALDVDDEQSNGYAVDRIEAAHGAIDVLVNNAGRAGAEASGLAVRHRARPADPCRVAAGLRRGGRAAGAVYLEALRRGRSGDYDPALIRGDRSRVTRSRGADAGQ